MPYLKKEAQPFEKLKRLLLGYELNAASLAHVLGCSANTARSRINRPERLTLADLDKINRVGHVPMDEIRAAIVK